MNGTFIVCLLIVLVMTNESTKTLTIPMFNPDEFKEDILREILKVRIPGTVEHDNVRDFIVKKLVDHDWNVEIDEFQSNTPHGIKTFTNIVSTFNPYSTERIVLACHYDSKYFKSDTGEVFLGASDSAVPCAMLVDIGISLAPQLKKNKSNMTLQLIFFDGEEAFETWNKDDSLYGSKHLADLMSKNKLSSIGHSEITQIDSIKLFILLDLIADCSPRFYNYIQDQRTDIDYRNFMRIEKSLNHANQFYPHDNYFYPIQKYFNQNEFHPPLKIEDDHIPFLEKNVSVLHFINIPFPSYWHETSDNENIICYPAIMNLLKIFKTFLLEKFDLYD